MNERIIKRIDTSTYNKIGNTIAAVSCCSFLAGQALSQTYVDASVLSYALSLFGYYEVLALYANNNKECTIDGKEVFELYREFIKRYSELNKKNNLNNPIEIFTLFNYLYRNGYLSKDKKFNYNLDAKTYNVGALMGANVITGEGVCRHISGMLSDIMVESGIDSVNLPVYSNDYYVLYVPNRSSKQEELFKWAKENVLDTNFWGRTTKSISQKVPVPVLKENTSSDFIYRIGGNHTITYASKDGINYYLDPTSETIFRMNPTNHKLYSSSEVLRIKSAGAKLIVSDKSRYKDLINRAKEYTGSISLEEEKQLVDRTHQLIEDNQSMFEEFYEDNKELYNEIKCKLLRLK